MKITNILGLALSIFPIMLHGMQGGAASPTKKRKREEITQKTQEFQEFLEETNYIFKKRKFEGIDKKNLPIKKRRREAKSSQTIKFITTDNEEFLINRTIVPTQYLTALSMTEGADGVKFENIESTFFEFAIDLMRMQWFFKDFKKTEYETHKELYKNLQENTKYSEINNQDYKTWVYMLNGLDYLGFSDGIISAFVHCFVKHNVLNNNQLKEEAFDVHKISSEILKKYIIQWLYIEQMKSNIEAEDFEGEDWEENDLLKSKDIVNIGGVAFKDIILTCTNLGETFTNLGETFLIDIGEYAPLELTLETKFLNHIDKKGLLKYLTKHTEWNASDIQNLNLTDNLLSTLTENTFQGFSDLRDINLSYNKLTELPANLFNSCPDLLTLDISGNPLTSLDPQLFANCPNLEYLFWDGDMELTCDQPQNIDQAYIDAEEVKKAAREEEARREEEEAAQL